MLSNAATKGLQCIADPCHVEYTCAGQESDAPVGTYSQAVFDVSPFCDDPDGPDDAACAGGVGACTRTNECRSGGSGVHTCSSFFAGIDFGFGIQAYNYRCECGQGFLYYPATRDPGWGDAYFRG